MPAVAADTPASAPRLDLWLVAQRGISRSAAQALVDAGLVRVNGRPARAGQRVQASDVVEVVDVMAPAAVAASEAAPLSDEPRVDLHVVYEDEWLAVIDKPAGLVVHPAPGHPHGTVADALRQRGDMWSVVGGTERAGIVHRLDRHTSGLMVVAKTEAAHRALAAQLADRSLGRVDWALVWGGVAEDTGRVDAPIGRDPRDRKRMGVVDRGRSAVTDFRVVERCPQTTVLDVSLRTGRTHQVRVHLAYIGRPLVGDPLYGRRHDPVSGRPALHARLLHFVHPADGAVREFEAPLPDDLVALLQRARAGTL
jgi:23S rRNA pseudouridine1911/1915/1917 synthase